MKDRKPMHHAAGLLPCLLFLAGLLSCAGPMAARAGEAAPEIVKAQLINSRDIELYWSEEVEGADQGGSFSVTVDGKANPIYSHAWSETFEEKGIVYYNPRSPEHPSHPDEPKTSIRLTDAIADVGNLPDIQVKVAGGRIRNAAGIFAGEQVVAVSAYEPFYRQEIRLDCGVRVLGSKNADPAAMEKAREMLEAILDSPAMARRMGSAGCMLGIYGKDEIAYDIPEHRFEYDERYLYVEGFGGPLLASIRDANVLRVKAGDGRTAYPDESILVHEFGHTIQNYGLSQTQKAELEIIYDSSVRQKGKWADSYAGSNPNEYFATLSAVWFNVMDDTYGGKWDGVRGPVNTREELKRYDRAAYSFLATVYPADRYLPSPWGNGTVPDHSAYEGQEEEAGPPYQRVASKASGAECDSCMEVNGALAEAGAKVDIWFDFADNSFLGWLFEKTDGNYYKIKFHASGLALMPEGGSAKAGAGITIGEDTGADAQLWRLEKTGEGCLRILNKASGLALTVSGGSVSDGSRLVLDAYEGSGLQQWKVYDASTKEAFVPEEAESPGPGAESCTVTFIRNNGKADIVRTVEKGAVVEQPEPPARKGYLFKGWHAGGRAYSFADPVEGDLALEAKWGRVTVGRAQIARAKPGKAGKACISIRKVPGADGYKVSWSRTAGFKKPARAKYFSSNKLTVSGLKKGTWHFKAAAYKLDSAGKKVEGKEGAAKKVTVK